MNQLKQSDKLDENSFIVLVCDIGDIQAKIDDLGIKDKTLAKKLLNSDKFRSNFTDLIMCDFWSCLESMIQDKENYLK